MSIDEGLAVGALVALIATATVVTVRPKRWNVVLLVVLAVVWVLVNSPLEIGVLIVINREHGVTVADLLSVAAVLLAARAAWSRKL